MDATPVTLSDLDTLEPAALKALILSQQLELLSHRSEIEHLKLLIAKLRRMQFGRRSDKIDRQIEQLELKLEELEASRAEAAPQPPSQPLSSATVAPVPKKRQSLPEHLPRVTQTHLPAQQSCAGCGGTMKKLGEDVSEMLEYIPASFTVIRHVRPRLCCADCEIIVQAPAPSRPIARGLAGPGLLAHVFTAKFCDHLPLYRQSEIYAREGVDLDRSTLAKWVGEASGLLAPLLEALRRYVLAAEKLHGDDTPVPVLAPGNGKTKTGRLWSYVRDDRPAGSKAAPAVWFAYSPDRKGEHPPRHLKNFSGILQADAYAGFNKLYENGSVLEAPCMAHIRRKFYDLMEAQRSPIATEAVQRIAPLYAIEKEIRGRSPMNDNRSATRVPGRYWSRCGYGLKHPWRSSRASQIPPRPSTMHSRVGAPSCATWTTAASRSITLQQNAPCVLSPSAVATISSLAPTPEANAQRSSIASSAPPSSTASIPKPISDTSSATSTTTPSTASRSCCPGTSQRTIQP